MWRTLTIFILLLAIHIYARRTSYSSLSENDEFDVVPDSLKNFTRSSSPQIDVNKALKGIESTCLSIQDINYLTGGSIAGSIAREFNEKLFRICQNTIGFEELNAMLEVRPPDSRWYCGQPFEDWCHCEWKAKKAAAKTIQEYFDLIAPRQIGFRNYDCEWFFEEQVRRGIAFLDKKMPRVRQIHRQKLEEVLLRQDAKEVFGKSKVYDLMDTKQSTSRLLNDAMYVLFNNQKCCQDKDDCEEKERMEMLKNKTWNNLLDFLIISRK
ncbi:hypothetical protein GCK72_008482 [Caenorhabditis remanei]|uniref:Uncharacterized protein n=1 Tax=Caenorhabditis remanei TaxID=31234 RepID=A0A6A5H0E3_CAERE|nr:hypothetical protein GCK72_008482 [Caenorhabditis remanei]KAF1760236.1 hypothetical protein GCK72_008482 [Caenorhabditis remanei]